MKRRLKTILAVAIFGLAGVAAAPSLADTLYESFGDLGLYAFSPPDVNAETYAGGGASNVWISGGQAFWQQGLSIHQGAADLSGPSLLWTNLVAPTDFAYDKTSNTLYESFGNLGLYAFSPPDVNAETFVAGDITNLWLSGGHAFWQDGLSIYEGNADLSDPTLLWTNLVAPTDFAYDETYNRLYESFGNLGLYAFSPPDVNAETFVAGDITNLWFSGGHAFWQEGLSIYEGNADLSDPTLLWTNLVAPTDFAVDASGGGAVPEPAAWAMMLVGFGLAGGVMRGRRRRVKVA